MAVTNLTGTKWIFNDLPSAWANDVGKININFISNSTNFTALETYDYHPSIFYYNENNKAVLAYNMDFGEPSAFEFGWQNINYKTIEILGGIDATNSYFIEWLSMVATQIIDEPTGPSIQGSAIPGATSYALYEKKNNFYNMLAVSDAINFSLGKLNLSGGTHKLVIRARAEDYEVSDYSNEVSYSVGVVYPEYLTFSSPSSFTLRVVDNKKYWDGTLEYSTDINTWSEWDGTSAISSSADGKLYMRGTGNTVITGLSAGTGMGKWVLQGRKNISCEGNIENLLDYAKVAVGEHPAMGEGCYSYMFYQWNSLTTAPELPATTLAKSCYDSMFYGCSSLTTAPELPATTLADNCYENMFSACSSLTTVPALPATTLAEGCYMFMFISCTNIKISQTQTSEYQTEYRIPISEDGQEAADALQGMFRNTGGTFKDTPTINTTYYTSNTVI